MAAGNTNSEDQLSEARQQEAGRRNPPEGSRSRRERMSDLIARVRHELERRADAGASLSELDALLVPYRRNPRLSVDQYDALWLYAWALLHRPGRSWGGHSGRWYDAVEPG
jgi:hypothetical protein